MVETNLTRGTAWREVGFQACGPAARRTQPQNRWQGDEGDRKTWENYPVQEDLNEGTCSSPTASYLPR
ncbi:MAG TPA: hypothetical protein VFX40_04190, partial [Gemmatimonadaceae bacterium]|nr:hypothetical protein [Gemmatimonadaceae bacterium]